MSRPEIYNAQQEDIPTHKVGASAVRVIAGKHFGVPCYQLLGGKWIAPRPTTSPALAVAIAYVWITEDLYDKEYVSTRTEGFDLWLFEHQLLAQLIDAHGFSFAAGNTDT